MVSYAYRIPIHLTLSGRPNLNRKRGCKLTHGVQARTLWNGTSRHEVVHVFRGGWERKRRVASATEGRAKSAESLVLGEDASTGMANTLTIRLPESYLTKKLLLWSGPVLLAYAISDFAGIVFGVFVNSFVGNSFVNLMQKKHKCFAERKNAVILYFMILLALITTFGALLFPVIIKQGTEVMANLQTENPYVYMAQRISDLLGDPLAPALQRLLLAADPDTMATAVGSSGVDPILLGSVLQKATTKYAHGGASFVSNLFVNISKVTLQSFVSMIFSFLLLWDLPEIEKGIQSLATSRIGVIYREVAPSVVELGKLIGKALQAQTMIALANTILTGVGLIVLGLPAVGFLLLLTFMCSFIPVAGVIISTVPMGLVALTEFGLYKVVQVAILVSLIHAVEAYILNPQIYGAHLELPPVLVLVVLVIGEHFMGVSGLLLAVPVTVFILQHVLPNSTSNILENAEKGVPSAGQD